jgi:hypothetical protein
MLPIYEGSGTLTGPTRKLYNYSLVRRAHPASGGAAVPGRLMRLAGGDARPTKARPTNIYAQARRLGHRFT